MSLNDQIKAYLLQSNISYEPGDYKTGQPENEADQILFWDSKLGEMPNENQLTSSYEIVKKITQSNLIRLDRNKRLTACDWTQISDSTADKTAWAIYRSELRDITKQTEFPWTIIWPTQP